MSRKGNKMSGTNIWLVIGVAVLVILLIAWLTIAVFTGDTDVAATVAPGLLSQPHLLFP